MCDVCYSESSACLGLLARTCRVAAPLQLLMLTLLGVALLLPLLQQCDDLYDCRLANSLRRSLDVVRTYPDGSPPV